MSRPAPSAPLEPGELAEGRRSAWRNGLDAMVAFRELALIGIILATALVMSQLSPYFLSGGNLRSVLVGLVPGAIMAVGMAVLLASGGFDLSVAAVMALCGTIAAWLTVQGVPVPMAILLTLLLGLLIGSGNGALVTQLGEQGPLKLPWMVWITLALIILGDLALRRTRFLRQVYYIGGNERAARVSGIPVDGMRVFTYMLSGTLAALAGVLLAARLSTAVPTAGAGLELTVIAAAVIGGASLAGGEGSVLGAVLGIAFLSIISNALTLLSVSIFWQIVVTGVVLIAAVSIDVLLRRRRV